MSKRSLSEAWVMGYNPLILLSTMANHDLSLVTHTVLQVESYITKGNGGRESLLTTASELEDRGGERDGEAALVLQQLAKDGYREASHCELLFSSLDERLSLVRKRNLLDRVVFPVTFTRDGHKVSLFKIRYGQRPDCLENLTFAQFCMLYAMPGDLAGKAKADHKVNRLSTC